MNRQTLTIAELKSMLIVLPQTSEQVLECFQQLFQMDENSEDLLNFDYKNKLSSSKKLHPLVISKEISRCLNYLFELIQV